MNPPIETLFRTRIQIGNFNPLQSYETNCPRPECGATFMLFFPVSILSLAERRVLEVGCPKCRREFSVRAGDLEVSEGTQLTAEVLFIR
jgi:hypothetical protein